MLNMLFNKLVKIAPHDTQKSEFHASFEGQYTASVSVKTVLSRFEHF